MSIESTPRFRNIHHLRVMLEEGEIVTVQNAPQLTTKSRLTEPTNGTATVYGEDGQQVAVLIHHARIIRVMTKE